MTNSLRRESPSGAHQGAALMQENYAAEYQRYEEEHWWFRARRRILQDVFSRLGLPPRPRILEIGAGPGANLYALYPKDAVLCGVEPDARLAQMARARGRVPVHEGLAEALPPPIKDETFDAVAMLDVLEHTADDRRVLLSVKERLVPGGLLLITVPAYMMLWGPQDVVSKHYRRYRRAPLASLIEQTGFVVERATYFNALLLAPIAAFRLLRRTGQSTDLKFTLGALDALPYAIFSLERLLLRWLNFPAGVSILFVARKR